MHLFPRIHCVTSGWSHLSWLRFSKLNQLNHCALPVRDHLSVLRNWLLIQNPCLYFKLKIKICTKIKIDNNREHNICNALLYSTWTLTLNLYLSTVFSATSHFHLRWLHHIRRMQYIYSKKLRCYSVWKIKLLGIKSNIYYQNWSQNKWLCAWKTNTFSAANKIRCFLSL